MGTYVDYDGRKYWADSISGQRYFYNKDGSPPWAGHRAVIDHMLGYKTHLSRVEEALDSLPPHLAQLAINAWRERPEELIWEKGMAYGTLGRRADDYLRVIEDALGLWNKMTEQLTQLDHIGRKRATRLLGFSGQAVSHWENRVKLLREDPARLYAISGKTANWRDGGWRQYSRAAVESLRAWVLEGMPDLT